MEKRVLISSRDDEENRKLRSFFIERDYQIFIEKPGSRVLYDLMKKDHGLMFCEIPDVSEDAVGTISIIKQLKPTLPIVTFSQQSSIEDMRKLHELNIYYALFKPLQMGEVETVVNAIEESYKYNRTIP